MNAETFLDGKVVLHKGDCLDVLKAIPDCCMDSVVTDPPYALVSITKRFGKAGAAPVKVKEGGTGAYARASSGFMGKAWDTGERAFAVEFWAEVWRVLKPGGHVAAFSGTRTYHRLAVAIEDAGFEIRDSIYWHYGSGFPKSHNINKHLKKQGACCECEKPIYKAHDVYSENVRDLRQELDADHTVSSVSEPDLREGLQGCDDCEEQDRGSFAIQSAGGNSLRSVRGGNQETAKPDKQGSATDLQQAMQRGASREGLGETRLQGVTGSDPGKLRTGGNAGTEKPSMEGRDNVQTSEGQLQGRSVCESAGMGETDGAQGRLHHGASSSDGANVRLPADQNGGREPHRPQSIEQSSEQSRIVSDKRGSQTWGGWPVCAGCGKPRLPEGLGTALKPATEPICLARKPLAGTVAANVLEHGTGAINVDGCRVEAEKATGWAGYAAGGNTWNKENNGLGKSGLPRPVDGRFPANLIHDGSEEVLAGFPSESGGASVAKAGSASGGLWSASTGKPAGQTYADSGSAARFFYTAKADATDRIGSKHPTVKPVDLMQWLCRLITPPGGTLLDPFAGTGTTGEAAWREGFKAILIERETEYQADIAERMRLALSGPEEKRREIIKRKGQASDAGPLFGEVTL